MDVARIKVLFLVLGQKGSNQTINTNPGNLEEDDGQEGDITPEVLGLANAEVDDDEEDDINAEQE